jgi:long-subunit fatty acid transport protein
MKLHRLIWFVGCACLPQLAAAGGLLLPGSGAVSTSRAGAAVASADDGEALSLNPAGIAKSKGHTITISAAIIQYAMEFQRRGTYDAVALEDYPYAGQPYALEKNDVSPPLGIGSMQPVPVIAFLTDLGGAVPGLHVGAGLYAPNAYPFRDMCVQRASGCQPYVFNDDPTIAPPGARYDIRKQEAAFILPSIAAAYRIESIHLDVGLRLSAGQATLKSTTGLWGTLDANYEENIKKDGEFTIDAKDSFVPAFGIGVAYQPTPNIELAANYASKLSVHAKGTATSRLGPSAGIPGMAVTIGPISDDRARCATGGAPNALKACVDLALPQNAQLAGRYKFLDARGQLKGDIELDLNWENWGQSCGDGFADGSCASPGDYRVVVDASIYVPAPGGGQNPALDLEDSTVAHGLRDTLGVRLGGSYHIALGAPREDQTATAGGQAPSNEIILRGGLGYETAAAKTGWLRADFDGAARTTMTVGAAYRNKRFEVSAGGGVILEGSPSNPNVGGGAEPCNPTNLEPGCGVDERQGPDPINPVLSPDQQLESPVNQGDFTSHYLLFMLGVTTWF